MSRIIFAIACLTLAASVHAADVNSYSEVDTRVTQNPNGRDEAITPAPSPVNPQKPIDKQH